MLTTARGVACAWRAQGASADDTERYGRVLFDFRYLKSPEMYDEKIDQDPVGMRTEARRGTRACVGCAHPSALAGGAAAQPASLAAAWRLAALGGASRTGAGVCVLR